MKKSPIQKYLSEIGARGGASGTGESKVRGDRSHYSAIASARWAKKREAEAAEAKFRKK